MDKQTLHACVFDWCCACDVIWNGLGELVMASRFSCFAAFNDAPINIILVIKHYPNICRGTCLITGVDKKRREIPLAPIYNTLGAMKAASLPGFHPLWGGGGGETTLDDLLARESWFSWKCWKNLTRTMTKYMHFHSLLRQNNYLKQPLMSLNHPSVSYICLTQNWQM